MQNFEEFIKENYGLTIEEYDEMTEVDPYEARIIKSEYDAMWKGFI